MNLAEYETEIESLENGSFAPAAWAVAEYGGREEATRAAARVMAGEIRSTGWSPACQIIADEIAARAEAVATKSSRPESH